MAKTIPRFAIEEWGILFFKHFSTFGGANQVVLVRGFEKPAEKRHLYLPLLMKIGDI
jgi:hypothetical protein